MATRGFLSPRRSRPGATEQGGNDEKKNQNKTHHRSSTISNLNPSKSPSTENLQQELAAATNKKNIFPYKSAPESALNSVTPPSTRRTNKKGKAKDDAGKSIHKSASSDTIDQYTSQSNAPTILYKIYEEIASHRHGNSTVKSYFKNLKALWDEAAVSSSSPSSSDPILEQTELMEREKLMQFLLGLNDSYSSLCSQILLVRPSPTVDHAYSLIAREEKTRKLKTTRKMNST